jgi:sugar O-acyltransferase (sialic acid O-acetyltransferase NeuD family)
MTLTKLVIIGGSNAFWEINELINDVNDIEKQYEVIAVLDDNPELQGKNLNGLIVDGPISKVKDFADDISFVFAIGSFRTRLIRAQILEKLCIPEKRFVTLIHPTAKIFSTSKIGNGCIVHYGTVVFNHSKIESFCVIAANCVIAVSNVIGKGALIGSNVTTTTGVKIGSYSFIGSSCSIGENVTVEPGAYIGLGSLILKNIKAGTFVLGNPPRLLDKVEVPANIINEWENSNK